MQARAGSQTTDRVFKLESEFTVVGRSMMEHADPDDLGRGDDSEPGPPAVNGKAFKINGECGCTYRLR